MLESQGVRTRLVSMPSWEFFAAQTREYRNSVIPQDVGLRVALEAGSPFGWERWVGDQGLILGMERFGASAPYEVLLQAFGFTAEKVASRIVERLGSTA